MHPPPRNFTIFFISLTSVFLGDGGDGRPYFSVGSGSTYAYGVLDSGYKWDMTEEEAITLGKKAIYHATYRDAYSGGINQVYVVRENGWERIGGWDVKEHHDRFGMEARTGVR